MEPMKQSHLQGHQRNSFPRLALWSPRRAASFALTHCDCIPAGSASERSALT
jgi:hypothetical protein